MAYFLYIPEAEGPSQVLPGGFLVRCLFVACRRPRFPLSGEGERVGWSLVSLLQGQQSDWTRAHPYDRI